MVKIVNKLITIICLLVLFVSSISCAAKTSSPALEKQFAVVQRGNLAVTVSVDGNLIMPQAYDLLFGTSGDVKDVLVEEGDFVKEGQVLARLDDTTQRLDIRSANGSVQTVLSNLYETVPLLPQFPTVVYTKADIPPSSSTDLGTAVTTSHTDSYLTGDTIPTPGTTTVPTTDTTTSTTTRGVGIPGTSIVTETITTVTTTVTTTVGPVVPGPIANSWQQTTTVTTQVQTTTTTTGYIISQSSGELDTSYTMYYPNAAAFTSFTWAQDEVNRARELFRLNKFAESASELDVAVADLGACMTIFEDTINNPQSGLGNIAPFISQDETFSSVQLYNSFAAIYIRELRQLIDSIKQGQADMEEIQELIAQEKYDEAAPLFEPLLSQVNDIGKAVIRNINEIKTDNYGTVYGQDLCLSLYGAAEDSINKAFMALGKYGLDSPEFNSSLRMAQHEMALCNGILGTNDYVLQHGLSLKAEQQYELDLQNAIVGLENKKDDFLKTVILAPFDGAVVSVGVKKNDVLSAMDYSSRTAVQLVDTSQIKFTGLVDEIDILKIKTGQKAMISVDAVPDKTFMGTVSFISPYGSKDTGTVVKFAVTIKLDPTDVELKGGLTATADVAVYDVQDVLLVPLSAITTTPAGSLVTVIDEATGKTEERKVVLGNQNYQFAEVLSGLQEGDSVVIQEKVTGAPTVTGFPRGPEGGGPPSGR